MPIYEFQCRGCSTQFEFLVLHNTTAACPSCQGHDLERLPTGFAVSTREMTLTRARKARYAAVQSKDHKDKMIAEAEHEAEHHH
jgi:putative FmdB family regulatory protein